jgi:hypothetical protein
MRYKMEQESNCTTHFLDLEISRGDNGIKLGFYQKPTGTDITVHNTSNNPEHKKNKNAKNHTDCL